MSFKKAYLNSILAFCFIAGFVSLALAAGQQVYKLVPSENSKVAIEGDSTFHRWHGHSTKSTIDSEIIVDSAAIAGADKNTILNAVVLPSLEKKFSLTVPVKTIESGIPGLAGKIHSSLNAKKYESIVFVMTSYEVKPVAAQNNKYTIAVKGTLTICGQSKDILIGLDVETTKSDIKVTGEYKLLMTDYGVKPPNIMFIKAANEVLVKWELFLDVQQVLGK